MICFRYFYIWGLHKINSPDDIFTLSNVICFEQCLLTLTNGKQKSVTLKDVHNLNSSSNFKMSNFSLIILLLDVLSERSCDVFLCVCPGFTKFIYFYATFFTPFSCLLLLYFFVNFANNSASIR